MEMNESNYSIDCDFGKETLTKSADHNLFENCICGYKTTKDFVWLTMEIDMGDLKRLDLIKNDLKKIKIKVYDESYEEVDHTLTVDALVFDSIETKSDTDSTKPRTVKFKYKSSNIHVSFER